MLKKLLEIDSMDAIASIGPTLLNTDMRDSLFLEIGEAGYILLQDDMWTSEEVAIKMENDVSCDQLVQRVRKEGMTTKIVHLLQMIAFCHRGISAPINNFLRRACL